MRKILSRFYRKAGMALPPALRLSVEFYRGNGYWPRISSPVTFNEKVLHRKIYWTDKRFISLADKLAARDIVQSILGPEVLAEIYAVYQDVEQISLEHLPSRFVMKCTHDSGSIQLIDEHTPVSTDALKTYFAHRLARVPSRHSYTRWYWDIPPRIVVEEHLGDENGVPPQDYKFFVFKGVVKMIQVDVDRFSDHRRNLYDRSWNPIPGSLGRHPSGPALRVPDHLDKMIEAAEMLSQDMDFVRVDLYSLPDRPVIFGEFTMGPGSGYEKFVPRNLDKELGSYWPV